MVAEFARIQGRARRRLNSCEFSYESRDAARKMYWLYRRCRRWGIRNRFAGARLDSMKWTMPFAPHRRGPLVKRRFCQTGCLAVLSIILVTANAKFAAATGYWNLPGNLCQWCGCGNSGGYHAPYVLGPPTGGCCSPWNEVRLPHAPNPYACAPGCEYGGAYAPVRPAVSPQPVEPPAPAEQVVPEANRRSLIFQPPVQY
jgi:hypothetical protein